MNYFLSESGRGNQENAIQKPRADSEKTMEKLGFKPVFVSYDQKSSVTKHFKRYHELMELSKRMKKGDTFLVQHPALRNTLFLKQFIVHLNKIGVQTVALIHDLNYIRINENAKLHQKIALYWKDKETLKAYGRVIVHNNSMKDELKKWGIPESRVVVLQLFDYLTDDSFVSENEKGVIIAGNLIKEKAEYCYNLPNKPEFNLYGINYESNLANNGENVHYLGVYQPENISVMKGNFGLVWDGNSIRTCSGDFGKYLKYNNPFKASTYLAAGLPIIVWNESALADFVEENKCGLVIDDLLHLNEKLGVINDAQYLDMKKNALIISKKIRNGGFLTEALKSIISQVE